MKFSRSLVLSFAALASASAFAPSSPIKKATGFPVAADPVATSEAVSSTDAASDESSAASSPASSALYEPMKDISSSSASASSSQLYQILPGRYDSLGNSIAVPFLKRPSKLDGSHAGDYGFDPLGLSETWDLYTMQEAEIRHARLAMLAVVGWPISELVAPDWMLQDGRAPSVLNGVNPLSFVAIALALSGFGLFEYMTCFRASANTPMGKKHNEDMAAVWKYGVAGDYNWDPLNLYSIIGDDPVARKGLREVEIAHGRQAMLGITAFAAWEALTGHPIVENSMFFHPNLLLPFLAASYVGFNQFYEIKNSDQYVFQIEMTEEGKMKADAIQEAMQQNEETNQKVAEFAEKAFETAKEYAGKAKKQMEEYSA